MLVDDEFIAIRGAHDADDGKFLAQLRVILAAPGAVRSYSGQVVENAFWRLLGLVKQASPAGPQTCRTCRFIWDPPRDRPAQSYREVYERSCVIDPPVDHPRVCALDRPACSRWTPQP